MEILMPRVILLTCALCHTVVFGTCVGHSLICLNTGMPPKSQKEAARLEAPKMYLGSTIISSLGVMFLCSVGIWVLNNFLMKEITELRSELDRVSAQLRESDDRLNSVTSLQGKMEKTLVTFNKAERDIGKLREKVTNLAEEVGKFHTKMSSLDKLNSKVKTVDENVVGLSNRFQSLGSQITAVDESVSTLERCFHCPCDFDRIVDSCYFIQRNRVEVSYDDAQKICESKNASLVTVNSLSEFNAIRNFLIQIFESNLYINEHGWLTGAKRIDGVLRWMPSNQELNPAALVWGANEPSNEECVTFFPVLNRNMNFADINCDKLKRQFICEL